MSQNIIITKQESLPADLHKEILPVSLSEGFMHIQWLVEDWEDGTNRFLRPGEAFYTACIGSRLVAVCGLNQDPFMSKPGIARLRRLYVLPDVRRVGIGRRLVTSVLEEAGKHFWMVRLRTTGKGAAAFFITLGFLDDAGDANASHKKILDRSVG
jgi:GNAT superfamily N-acetyltransferase